MKKYLFLAIAIMGIALFIFIKLYERERTQRKRQEGNVHALLTENEAFRTKEGKWAMSVEALELKKNEFEKLCSRQAATIKSQNIKIKRLETYSDTRLNTSVDVVAPVRDTIILRDTVAVRAKAFHWSDPWVSVNGIIENDKVACRIVSIDSLQQYVFREPHKFLFFRWGTKALRQNIVSSNPHTKIVYNQYIKIIKR